MAGARALWRATGMTDDDFGKPIVAIANSYTQFVPGHVHLKDMGALVAEQVAAAGGVGREFHTIAVDDGIAMGHGGMLYSLPSREIIADSVEYMVNAHCADALVCISNCDKITPGMLERGAPAERAHRVRVGRADGGRQGVGAQRRRPCPVRSDHGHLGVCQRRRVRRRPGRDRAFGVSHVRVVFGHVHRQLDELPHRGAGLVAAGQRIGAGHARGPQGAVRGGRTPRGRPGHPLLPG